MQFMNRHSMEIQLKFIFIQSVGKVRSAFQTSSTSTIVKVATIDKSLITRNKKIRYTSTLGHDDNQFRFFIQLHIADLVRSWLENFKCKHHLLNYSIKYWKLTTTVHQIPCIHQLQIISSVILHLPGRWSGLLLQVKDQNGRVFQVRLPQIGEPCHCSTVDNTVVRRPADVHYVRRNHLASVVVSGQLL